jgi:hypothetical protein
MIKTSHADELHHISADPRYAALRSELEATRSAFHVLLESVAKAGRHQKSPSSAWTIGEVLVHLTWALEYLPAEVEKARRGQGMFNLPKWLADPASYWYMRWIARSTTPQAIARRYDRAMDASIRCLETIQADDWPRGANFYGEGFHSVEDLFHVPAVHLAEHTAGLSAQMNGSADEENGRPVR